FGSTFDVKMEGKIRVSVVATGIQQGERAEKSDHHRAAVSAFRPKRQESHEPVEHIAKPQLRKEAPHPIQERQPAPYQKPAASRPEPTGPKAAELKPHPARQQTATSYPGESASDHLDEIEQALERAEKAASQPTSPVEEKRVSPSPLAQGDR